MRAFAAVAVLLSAASFGSAQNTTNSIDPKTVPAATRNNWCQSQKTQCPLLCLQFPNGNMNTRDNTCNANTLDYSCVCTNGQSPNASQYSLTIPYYLCTEANNQCVKGCGQNNQCSDDCRTKNPCGAQDPLKPNSTSSSSTAISSPSSSPNGDFDSLGGNGGKSGASASITAMGFGQTFGLAIVLSGVFAGFAIML